ncbi:MAG: hypothetical protein OZSIB_0442 [Candidatus Ozemobacter sibiricus]|jgi:glyoxylase-like metal-dependent hydrolase (beta-lactamase superfamily II)|uniref:Metallo-beta-lactamase domain-containing protein n=1 Tax=Candidatus Ozemobacter sibiricus TaxID=2268124 RepID=A0A367ZM29_9BACT|nr:MAG: hypothetical protein OZSIB_0442 [Candidatus Ozemobacter sibiricus]
MRIIPLARTPRTYSATAYLVLGTWNRLDDVNTLIDVGIDEFIAEEISRLNTGVGKRPVERIILTHNHFDHAGGAAALKERYKAELLAWAPGPGVDRLLQDGEELRLGDEWFEVIHMPGHSHDSICLYNRSEGVLFSGDSPLRIHSPNGTYLAEFVAVLDRLASLPVRAIYPGHDAPILSGAADLLRQSAANARQGILVASRSCGEKSEHAHVA